MLTLASNELGEWRESNSNYETVTFSSQTKPRDNTDSPKLFADKLCVPPSAAHVARPRLVEHLQNSLAQFSATLIAGRAGTGKTALAADYARRGGFDVAWYKVETADGDWKVFLSYLVASLSQFCAAAPQSPNIFIEADAAADVAPTTETLAAQIASATGGKPLLIVLDDLHSVFDAVWFTEFFYSFVLSLPANVQLLLIARTLPQLPLWRLRSKQVLGVTDEKLLAFTLEETVELFRKNKLSASAARAAHKRSYGRISKLEEISEKKSISPEMTLLAS